MVIPFGFVAIHTAFVCMYAFPAEWVKKRNKNCVYTDICIHLFSPCDCEMMIIFTCPVARALLVGISSGTYAFKKYLNEPTF